MELKDHYGQLLGIDSPWGICKDDFKLEEQRVDITIEYTDDEDPCPGCGASCPKHDTRKQRSSWHLDTMQFAIYLHCEIPRVRCKIHGLKSLSVPWAGKNSRFTLLFKSFAIRALQAASRGGPQAVGPELASGGRHQGPGRNTWPGKT